MGNTTSRQIKQQVKINQYIDDLFENIEKFDSCVETVKDEESKNVLRDYKKEIVLLKCAMKYIC